MFVLIVALIAGCASTDGGAPSAPFTDGQFVITYNITGSAPIYSLGLPFSAGTDEGIKVTFDAAGARIDSSLRPHPTMSMRIFDEASSAQVGGAYLDATTLSLVEVSLIAGELPEAFREQVILRDATEASCFGGSAFLGRAIGKIEVPIIGEIPLAFDPVGGERILGRDTTIYEATTAGGGLVRLWVDPSLPCPLKGEREGQGLRQFQFAATSLSESGFATTGGATPGPPLVPTSMAPARAFGIPPQDGGGDRFAIQEAFDHALLVDLNFQGWISSHPQALLVEASYAPFERQLQRIEIWQLTFESGGEGYRVDVHRKGPAMLKEAAIDSVTESGPTDVIVGPSRSAIADAEQVATLDRYFDVQLALLPAIQPNALRISLLQPAPIATLEFTRQSTGTCQLTVCTSESLVGSFSFDPVSGDLLGFSGGFAAWDAAQPT